MKKRKLIWIVAMIALGNCVTNSARAATPSPVQKEREILAACRTALLDLKKARETEDALKEKVAELERQNGLKQERIGLLTASITEYELATVARQKAESVVEELRKNHAAQMAVVEAQLANEKRKVFLWQVVAAAAVIFALLTGTRK